MKSNPESLPDNKDTLDPLAQLRQAEPTRSFDEMREYLVEADPSVLRKLWVAITEFLTAHKGLYSKPALAGYGFAILLIVACQVPTEYTKEVGQALRVTTTSDLDAIVQFIQEQEGNALTDVNATMQVSEDGTRIGEALFSFEGGDIDMEALLNDVERLQGVETAVIEPITHEFRGNLVAAALHKAINLDRVIIIDLNITDLTAVEIEQAVEDRFAAEGIDASVTVDVVRDSSRSMVSIKTELTDSTGAGDLPPIMLEVQDDNVDRYPRETEDVQVIRRTREAGTRSVIRDSEMGIQSVP